MVERTEENVDLLAQLVVDSMDIGDLIKYAKDSIEETYKNDRECFEQDWNTFMQDIENND